MKKQKKRTKRTKRTMKRQLFFSIMLFSAILLLIMSITFKTTSNTPKDTETDTIMDRNTQSPPSNARYQKSIDVDCLRLEPAYEHIIDWPNYDVWYANNRSRHFIFINSTSNLAGKSILVYTEDFNYSLTPERVRTSFLLSYHVNDTLEFAIERILLGYYGEETNDFSLLIDTYIIQLHVGPASPPSGGVSYTMIIGDDDDDKEYVRLGIIESWMYDFENMPTGWKIVWVAFWVSFLWQSYYFAKKKHRDYFKNPRLFVQNSITQEEWNEIIPKKRREKIQKGDEEIDYKKDIIKLGRYLKETESKSFPGYIILYFKHARHFILKIYCKERIAEINDTKKDIVYWIRKEQWEYELRTLKLPENKQYAEEIIKDTWKNKLLLILGRITPSKKLPLILYDKLEWEKTGKKVKKVLLLRNIYDSEYLTVIVDVKFERLEPTENDPDNWVKDDFKQTPWYRIELMKRDPSIRFSGEDGKLDEENDISNKKVAIVNVEKKYRALFRSTADNERNTYEFRESEYIEDLEKRNKIIDDLTYENALLVKMVTLKKAKFMKELMLDEYGGKDKFLLDFKSDFDMTKNFEESKERALERERMRIMIRKLEQEKEEFQQKKSKIKNQEYLQELEIKVTRLTRKLEALKKGDGTPKKEEDIFDELTTIKKGIEKEEEETD